MAAGVVLRESQIAVNAKFSGYARAAKFFCEPAKRERPPQQLSNLGAQCCWVGSTFAATPISYQQENT